MAQITSRKTALDHFLPKPRYRSVYKLQYLHVDEIDDSYDKMYTLEYPREQSYAHLAMFL